MAIYNLQGNETLSKEELDALKEARGSPIVYDDAPELTPEMEAAFIAARRAKPYNSEAVTLYVSAETIAKAKHMGSDYIAFLGRVLDQAVAEYRAG